MGPESKAALCNVLGHLIDELQLQRVSVTRELGRLRSSVEALRTNRAEELEPVNRRLTELERLFRRGGGAAPAPAE